MRADEPDARQHVRVPVIPVLEYPDGHFDNESTHLAYDLEERHPERSILPPDPARRFLADLLEDMADEWATKAMFHYRWFYPADQEQLSLWLAYDRLSGDVESIRAEAAAFRDRQVSRMPIVGCTEANRPLIEESTRRLLAIFEEQVGRRPYFFGSRPSIAEFAWYGQLSQLAVDPTPAALMRSTAPLTMRWVMQIDDASGVEGDWDDSGHIEPGVEALLDFAGAVYLPFLLANDAAVRAGVESFDFSALGHRYGQGTFKFQVKCLARLRALYAELPGETREELDPLLRRTGCLDALSASA